MDEPGWVHASMMPPLYTQASNPGCGRRDQRLTGRHEGEDDDVEPAIICDLDGTLADLGDRHPFDFKRVDQDTVKHATAELVRIMHRVGYRIILFSGRNDSARDLTISWLKLNEIPFDELSMRRTGDRRKDSVVKRQMYEQTVAGKYDVLFVLDDRDQVVDMWRKELKLPCFQVDYGDF